MNIRAIGKLAIAIALAAAVWWWNPWRTIKHPPGILAPTAPEQRNIKPGALTDVKGWSLTALAEYRLTARVLGTKRYRSGFASDIAPIDIALGWGRMSDQAVLDRFAISMGNRFYFYEWENEPAIPAEEIMRSSANNHLIAANDDVRKTIASLIPGHIVILRGYLVNATGPDGEKWNSSLRRDDTGNGACEVFLVQEASVAN